MDITSTIIVSLIVSAFLIFAGVLAYGDHATRQARRDQANKAILKQQPPRPDIQHRDAA